MSDQWEDENEGNINDEMFNGTGEEDIDDRLATAGSGNARPPSVKQVQFAKKIETATHVPLPEGYNADWRIISEYIDTNKAAFEKVLRENPLAGGGKGTPPSEKQLGFARLIAERLSVELPEGCKSDWRITRKFIDDNKSDFESLPRPEGQSGGAPSEKQVSLARLISDKGGIPLPDGYDSDWRIIKRFIDENKGVLGNGGPRKRPGMK